MVISAFRSRLVSGVRWTAVANVALLVGGLVQTMILSRVLERKDFGLVAMAGALLGFLQLFSDVGLSNVLIAKRDLSVQARSTIYWANLVSGLCVGLLAAASAPLQAAFFSRPELVPLIWCIAPGFVIAAAGQPLMMIARRELRFRRVSVGSIIAAVTLLLTSVGLALAGAGAYALVFGTNVSFLARTIYYLAAERKHWLPQMHFSFRELREVISFGVYQTLGRLCSHTWNNIEYALIGRFMGPDPVALYRLASELPVRPMSFITPLVNTVAFPAFARKQADREAVRRGVLEITRFLATAVFPMLFGLAVTAPLVIPVVFSPKWMGAVPLVPILCLLAGSRLLSNPVESMLLGLGLVRVSFTNNAILAGLALPIFTVCATISLRAVAWAAALIYLTVFIGRWRAVLGRPISLGPKAYLGVLVKPAAMSALMGGVVWLVMGATAGRIVWLAGRLAVCVACGAVVYLILLRVFDWPYVSAQMRLLLGRRPAPEAAGEEAERAERVPPTALATDILEQDVSPAPSRSPRAG